MIPGLTVRCITALLLTKKVAVSTGIEPVTSPVIGERPARMS